jgi:hypothetical protein
MKKLLVTLSFLFYAVWSFGQVEFTKDVFLSKMELFQKDAVKAFQTQCVSNFMSGGSEESVGDLNRMIEMFSRFRIKERTFTKDLNVRQFESTGVVTGQQYTVFERKDGTTFIQDAYITYVFVKHDNDWKLAYYSQRKK